jgi:hypothetical protein
LAHVDQAPVQVARILCNARGEPRRESGRRKDFRVKPEEGAEGLDEGGEGGVAVPAEKGADYEVVQAEAVFDLAVVVLDPPADLGDADQFAQQDVGGQGGQPVCYRWGDYTSLLIDPNNSATMWVGVGELRPHAHQLGDPDDPDQQPTAVGRKRVRDGHG